MRIIFALVFGALLLVGSCQKGSAAKTASRDGFTRWTTESSPLNFYSVRVNDGNNWYFPARLDSFELSNPVWNYSLESPGNLSVVSGKGVLFFNVGNRVLALRAESGELLWQVAFRDEALVALHLTPYFLAVGKGGRDLRVHGLVHLLDPLDGNKLGDVETAWPVMAAFHDERRFYVLSYPSNIVVLDLMSGDVVENRLFTREILDAVRGGETIITVGSDGGLSTLSTVDLSLQKIQVGEKPLTQLVAGDDWLMAFERERIVPGPVSLVAFNLPDLTVRWRHRFPDYVQSEPARAGDRVVGATYYGEAFALSWAEGSVLWTRDMEAPSHVIAVFGDRALVWSEFYVESELERYDEKYHRFFSRVPSWLPKGATRAYAYSLLDVRTGELLQREVVTRGLRVLTFAPGVMVFKAGGSGEIIAYPAKYSALEDGAS